MLKYFTKNLERRKSRFIFALQTWGFPHLLINLTNLTLGVRKFPRLSDTILLQQKDGVESLSVLPTPAPPPVRGLRSLRSTKYPIYSSPKLGEVAESQRGILLFPLFMA